MKNKKVYRIAYLIAVLAILLGGQSVTQAEAGPVATGWPQWRGPNRDGKSADTGLELPASTNPITQLPY